MNEPIGSKKEAYEEKREKSGLLGICPIPALVAFAVALVSAVIHVGCVISEHFSDLMNTTVSAAFRFISAKITGLFPFSVAETILLFLPVIFICMIVYSVIISRDETSSRRNRYFAAVFSFLSLFYSFFVFSMVPGYNGSTVEDKLGLNRQDVTADQLYKTAVFLGECVEAELDEIDFIVGENSVMPYSVAELSEKLCSAYDSFGDEYAFIQRMNTKIKSLTISDLMTYTHIAGVYTYYTGEANLNTTFPDYTIPFTTAHELSHQRGIAREDEANFIAFLVCAESNDPYIRYSGYLNLFEYVSGALYEADSARYRTVISDLDTRVRYELSSYSSFFEKYQDSTVSQISNTVNDTYLKAQGQEDGAESYGRVVDLAVAYFESENSICD